MKINSLIIVLKLLTITHFVFSQHIDTIYNEDKSYEFGLIENGKRKGKWIVKGIFVFSYHKYYNNDTVLVEIYEKKFKLSERFYLLVTDTGEIKHGNYDVFSYSGYLSSRCNFNYGKLTQKKIFNNDSTIEIIENYKLNNDTIEFIEYFKNGKIKEKGLCLNNNGRIGEWIMYYENGNIYAKGFYNGYNYILVNYDNGATGGVPNHLKHGMWEYWNEKGVLIKKEKYCKGKLCKIKIID